MRFRIAVSLILLVASLALAYREETLEQLKERAEAVRMEDRPSLYVEIANRQLKAADELYRAGKEDEAGAAVEDIVAYSQKAHDASAQTGKRLKNTEIALRKMAAKLRDIKPTLNFADQAPIEAAADQLEKLRTDLLSRMFARKER